MTQRRTKKVLPGQRAERPPLSPRETDTRTGDLGSPGRARVSPGARPPSGQIEAPRGLNLPPGQGRAGEAAAESHLRSLGYRIIARNYRTREGEVDIVAMDGDTYAFVEVKTRRAGGSAFGAPEESLTKRKAASLVTAAGAYLVSHGLAAADWRIDLVAVALDRAGHVKRMELFRGAVADDT